MSTIIPNTVIIWSGAIVDIPEGWFLCDGSNGTPDLRNRFVVGAGSSYGLDATGGSANAITPSHTHSFTSIGSGGSHNHSVGTYGHSGVFGWNGSAWVGGNQRSAWGGAMSTSGITTLFNGIGSHSHSGGTISNAGVDGTNRNLPPYYALAFIMKGEE